MSSDLPGRVLTPEVREVVTAHCKDDHTEHSQQFPCPSCQILLARLADA